jgi:hypothetical protein
MGAKSPYRNSENDPLVRCESTDEFEQRHTAWGHLRADDGESRRRHLFQHCPTTCSKRSGPCTASWLYLVIGILERERPAPRVASRTLGTRPHRLLPGAADLDPARQQMAIGTRALEQGRSRS